MGNIIQSVTINSLRHETVSVAGTALSAFNRHFKTRHDKDAAEKMKELLVCCGGGITLHAYHQAGKTGCFPKLEFQQFKKYAQNSSVAK